MHLETQTSPGTKGVHTAFIETLEARIAPAAFS